MNYFPTGHDNVLYFLDMGMLNFYNGDSIKSNELLSKAEIALENNFTKSMTQYASSFILDDRMLNYCGEDYEDIYLNVFKAINFFVLNNIDAAGVELRRVNEKLAVLYDKYNKLAAQLNQTAEIRNTNRKIRTERIHFHDSALSRYLSSIHYQFEKKYDDVRIDIQHIYAAFQNQQRIYDFNIPRFINDLYQCVSIKTPQLCLESSNAQVNFIAFAGRSPEKKAKTYWIITQKNRIIIAKKKNGSGRMDVIPWPGIKKGYFFKFSLPYMQKRDNTIKKIVVLMDQQSFKLEKLEDIANIATETFNLKKNMIYLKTIVRSTVKGILAAEVKKGIDQKKIDKKNKTPRKLSFGDSLWIESQKFMVDIAMDIIEKADLRISSFFPAEAYSGKISVRPGSYHLKIIYYDNRNMPIKEKDLGKQLITLGGLNLFQSSYYGVH